MEEARGLWVVEAGKGFIEHSWGRFKKTKARAAWGLVGVLMGVHLHYKVPWKKKLLHVELKQLLPHFLAEKEIIWEQKTIVTQSPDLGASWATLGKSPNLSGLLRTSVSRVTGRSRVQGPRWTWESSEYQCIEGRSFLVHLMSENSFKNGEVCLP